MLEMVLSQITEILQTIIQRELEKLTKYLKIS